MDFYDLDLNDQVLDALDDMNFTECTPIQEHAIPVILEGRDLIGVAQTGTGKTAAFLLPILSKLSDGGYPADAINCVIMSPTRELAQQIDQAMEGFSYYMSVSSVAIYGGNDGIRYEQEKKGLAMGADVIIATPGRLISHLSLGNVDLSKVSFFVLDEADRMLDMGFHDDIMQIVKHLPKERQTIMFSATMPKKIQDLARTILNNPVEVKLAVSRPADKIVQSAYICYETQKIALVKKLFTDNPPQRVIIFASSKQKVKDMAIVLKRAGFNVGAMHSDLDQRERDEVMYQFKAQQINVLVATDIVARGIDIDDIQLVINFDVPHDAEDYVHRIGRTARANNDGEAITLVSEKDLQKFSAIERFLKISIERRQLPDGMSAPDKTAVKESRKKDGNRKGKDQRNRKDNQEKGREKGARKSAGTDRATETPETGSGSSAGNQQEDTNATAASDMENKKRKRPSRWKKRRKKKAESKNEENAPSATSSTDGGADIKE